MIRLMLTVFAIMTPYCELVRSTRLPFNLCSSTTLITIDKQMPYVNEMYIDGSLVDRDNGPVTIDTGSRVVAFGLKKGLGHIAATAAQMRPVVSKIVCTNIRPDGNLWTMDGFLGDSSWPISVELPLTLNANDVSSDEDEAGLFNGNLKWVVKQIKSDIYCRAYLRCAATVSDATTTPETVTEPPTTAAVTTQHAIITTAQQTGCPPDYFICDGGMTCVAPDEMCNGNPNCHDGFDEDPNICT